MKKALLALLLGAGAASQAVAYNHTDSQVYVDIWSGYVDIDILKDGDAKPQRNCVHFRAPRLDGVWRPVVSAFTPDRDGVVFFRFGPCDLDHEPAFYRDIKINGVDADAKLWKFNNPYNDGERKGGFAELDGKPCLKLWFANGAERSLPVKKGERVEISMLGKSGSVLELFKLKLEGVSASLGEPLNAGCKIGGSTLEKAEAFSSGLESLRSLMESKLGCPVKPLADAERSSLPAIKAKLDELSAFCDAETARTVDDAKPVLYDQPEERKAILGKIKELELAASRLETGVFVEALAE